MTSTLHRSSYPFMFSVALGLARAASAGAQEPGAVMLHTSTCMPEDDAALRRALEVELRALDVEPRWASTEALGAPARITLNAQCDESSDSVAVEVWSNTPRLVLSRSVALRDVAEPARARTLALVISESLAPTLGQRAAAATIERIEPPPASAEGSQEAPRLGRAPGFIRRDPYVDGGSSELFTTTNPYGVARSLRLGGSAQARLALRDSSSLLGLELNANGPAAEAVDWTFEVSHASATEWSSDLDVSWWHTAFGADFVHLDGIGVALGPRLSFGHLRITRENSFELTTERTLVAQLGARAKFEVPVAADRYALQVVFGAQHTLGVYALTSYTGLDEGLNGWVVSWGVGLTVEP